MKKITKKKIFAIGDIHGCNRELRELIKRLPLTDDSTVVFLGDYIDRGPESKQTIQTILELSKHHNIVTLKGNHEKMFLDFIKNNNTPEASAFLYNGGTATLASYSDEFGNYMFPKEHLEFLNSLDLFYETDDAFFVHAGLPDTSLQNIKNDDYEDDLLWIRESFFESKYEWNKLIIHGHTPVLNTVLSPKRINIDTGCVFEGKLTAIELPEQILYSVPKQKKIAGTPKIDNSGHNRRGMRFEVIMPVVIQTSGKKLKFQTINYSDFGMLIHSTTSKNTKLEINVEINGTIGAASNSAEFRGMVLRSEKKVTGDFYAIKFTKAPINFLKKMECY